jgi:hypothetical protein
MLVPLHLIFLGITFKTPIIQQVTHKFAIPLSYFVSHLLGFRCVFQGAHWGTSGLEGKVGSNSGEEFGGKGDPNQQKCGEPSEETSPPRIERVGGMKIPTLRIRRTEEWAVETKRTVA